MGHRVSVRVSRLGTCRPQRDPSAGSLDDRAWHDRVEKIDAAGEYADGRARLSSGCVAETNSEVSVEALVAELARVFHEAEGAAGFAKGTGEIKFDLSQTHSSLAYVSWGPNGLTYDLAKSRQRFPLG